MIEIFRSVCVVPVSVRQSISILWVCMCCIVGISLLVRFDLMFWVAILHWSFGAVGGLC